MVSEAGGVHPLFPHNLTNVYCSKSQILEIQLWVLFIHSFILLARYSKAYILGKLYAIVRVSVCPSVRHTGGSYDG